ncbi:Tripartite tricarboxylate transporter TctB family protein [Franzmannia pantelleriensis]|uniref:Tripartite tricarboxylate transporter TctB family protein n=1 Tax=Franzmannia pantelleriensis TaxID=48727 RepID=A0A1G9EA09_9GAMM|nr:tripartite tricarboxylate transporter TctB family protein [Halomonas pantelleriensis]SDK72983.1 Tripartite tricarboxylate transporter TctB family protein [Halomonas pantelleriensis]
MGIARGVMVTALFGIVLLVMIPLYVPRPSFIPGFAPPPDMWPRAVSLLGMVLGLLLLALSLSKKTQAIADPEDAATIRGNTPLAVLLVRFGWSVLAFALFVGAVSLLGFLLASILLLVAMLVLTGYWRRKRVTLIVAVALPLLLYLFFSSALNTRFPTGSLLRALGV